MPTRSFAPTQSGVPSLDAAIALHRGQRLDEAQAAYRAILAAHPRDLEALSLLGVCLVQAGAPGEGIPLLQRAVEGSPRNATFLHNLGVACDQAGRVGDAVSAYERATRAAPDALASWSALGLARERSGDLAGAGEAFLQVLSLDPAHPLAATNLGSALGAALESGGGSSPAVGEVLTTLWRHVQAEPGDVARWTNFTELLRNVAVETPATAAELMPVLLACLLEDGVEHQRLTRVAFSVLRHHDATAPLCGDVDAGADALDLALARDGSWEILAHPVVRLVLERTVVPQAAWERLFTRARRRLALLAAQGHAGDALPSGMEEAAFSIARQCFHNGYVWAYDADEEEAVERIARAMEGRPLGAASRDRLDVAILASYVPLSEWERAAEMAAWSEREDDLALAALVRQQILEPAREEEIKPFLPTVGALATAVSEKVQEMYEEHPYPRWLSFNAARPAALADIMRARFPTARTERLAGIERPRILVAGCGTGQHLLSVASRYADAEVVGVDLSRASLAYAARKASEMGFERVSVVQADILSLGALEDRFHLIESVGVLHHMEDPEAGWKVLHDLLLPGGFMKIGLYSEAARAAVVEARAFIAARGWTASGDDIRTARPEITRHFADRPEGSPAIWRDFFSMHECRDLLFHVQEQRFTLPRITRALEALGLEFLGWDGLDGSVLSRFRQRFPDPADARDLGAWHRFEMENPSTFSSMYQFWLQKAG